MVLKGRYVGHSAYPKEGIGAMVIGAWFGLGGKGVNSTSMLDQNHQLTVEAKKLVPPEIAKSLDGWEVLGGSGGVQAKFAAASQLAAATMIQRSVKTLVESNKRIAESNEHHAFWMRALTFAIAVFAFLEVWAMLEFSFWFKLIAAIIVCTVVLFSILKIQPKRIAPQK